MSRESVVAANRSYCKWNGLLSRICESEVAYAVPFTLRRRVANYFSKLGGTTDLTSFVPFMGMYDVFLFYTERERKTPLVKIIGLK